MADTSASGAADDAQEQQITFNVKSSADAKYVLTLALSATVGDLKQKLSSEEHANIPAERQRLIYSGRVLKDHDTIGTCKIKDGNTVHLVKGADSNTRQNPANQGGSSVPAGAGQPASNVPSNIAAGTGAGNPLAQLTGARYAGFHGLPGMETFGADGGMGAPPNPDQMLRLLEDPNFASQMNEAMNNPAVVDMLRNNPMIRNNPIARQAIENPEFRRMMLNPDMIRMQMQMQQAFPMPGATDTTQNAGNESATAGQGETTGQQTGSGDANAGAGGNPFAALFGGGAPGSMGAGMGAGAGTGTGTDSNQQNQNQNQNPMAGLFGNQQGGGTNPMAQMTQQLMQNPQMMQQMMQMMGGGGGAGGNNTGDSNNTDGANANPFGGGGGGFNPFNLGMGDFGGQQQPSAPPDNRPPEERYEDQLRQLNDMGFYEFERNVNALRRSGGSVQGAVEFLLSGS